MILVAAAIAGGFYFRSRQTTTRLTEKDSIVLAEFTNTTGDPVFDGTLRQGLSAQLEQSPFLSLLSDQRVGADAGSDGPAQRRPAHARVGPRSLPAHRQRAPPSKARFPAWAASMSWG